MAGLGDRGTEGGPMRTWRPADANVLEVVDDLGVGSVPGWLRESSGVSPGSTLGLGRPC